MYYVKQSTNMRRSINHSLFLRCILSCIFISFLSDLCGQSNYVRTYVPKEPVSPGISLNESNALVSTAYYDSGGRLVQTVHHGITPSGKDMADLIVYDHVGVANGSGNYCLLTVRTVLINRHLHSILLRIKTITMWTMNTSLLFGIVLQPK